MSPTTKAEAKRKLATLKVGIAYPDKWRDYSGLQSCAAMPSAIFSGRRNSSIAIAARGSARPVDRDEWVMTPQTVNAVNLPILNALNFPAAILQAPFYDPAASAAVNYGAIGATIGHEISHSFDDTGAQFDAQRALAQLVDAGRPEAIPGGGRGAGDAVRRL